MEISAILTITAAGVVSAIRMEDDMMYAAHQHASDFTSVTELLFVTKQTRNVGLDPRTLCQALLKLRHVQGNTFRYIVYFAPRSTPLRMTAFVTTLITSIAEPLNGVRWSPNAIAYQTSVGGPVCSYKVMFADPEHGCFILVSFGPRCGRGCRLLQTASTVDREIPRLCNRVYAENCAREFKKIYYPICPMRLPHIVQWDS